MLGGVSRRVELRRVGCFVSLMHSGIIDRISGLEIGGRGRRRRYLTLKLVVMLGGLISTGNYNPREARRIRSNLKAMTRNRSQVKKRSHHSYGFLQRGIATLDKSYGSGGGRSSIR
jgi:hypothetical protein